MYAQWMALSLNKRHEVAAKFGVSKTGPTHVQDNRVVADGYDYGVIEKALIAKFETIIAATNFLERVAHLPIPDDEVAALVSEPVVLNDTPIEPAPYCAHCTSKGPRHTKVCNRPK